MDENETGGKVRCKCGNPKCKIGIRIAKKELWFTDADNHDGLMYMDANTVVELIHELKNALEHIAIEE
jgi:hypothetical protein